MQDRGKPRSDKADQTIAGAEGKKLSPGSLQSPAYSYSHEVQLFVLESLHI